MMSQLQEARIPAHTVVDPSAYANDRIHETYCRLRRQSACKAICNYYLIRGRSMVGILQSCVT
jgi:hypothetical protein